MTLSTEVRAMEGLVPLPARAEPWMREVLVDHAALTRLLDEHGSPVNLIDPSRLREHAAELVDAAATRDVELRIFFARKANKTLALVDATLAAGHGVDVASQRELEQVLERLPRHGALPTQVIVSAAIKPRALLELCVRSGVTVSIDNGDELALLGQVAAAQQRTVDIALRIAAEIPGAESSRFGQDAPTIRRLLAGAQTWSHLRLVGLHFHLHGYSAAERAVALDQALDLVEVARFHGHSPDFVDIGGGVPMRYVDERDGWDEFWRRHSAGDHMTWRDHPVGQVYPVWQSRVRGEWLLDLLDHPVGGRTLALRVRELGVRLHAEPGRALLDGCGLTAARVEMRKQQRDGTWLVGLAMNRTQCRSAAADFLVDPVLVPAPGASRTPAGEGYLVGAYCIEDELLTRRRLRFRQGAAVGDIVAFINTAGYQMHILESASHQIPLARNLVHFPDGSWQLDAIDADTESDPRVGVAGQVGSAPASHTPFHG